MTQVMSQESSNTPSTEVKAPSSSFTKKTLKLILGLFFVVLGLAIVLPLAAFFFFDANAYKKEIATYLSQKTGLPIEIEGKLDLKFYPWVGLKAKDVRIAQAPQFGNEPFVTAKELGFQIPLQDILHFHFAIETLLIKDAEIHLIKEKNGASNWDYYLQKVKQTTQSKKEPQLEKVGGTEKENSASKKLQFSLAKYELNNATVVYTDNAQNQRLTLEKVFLSGQGIMQNQAYPLEGKFDFTLDTQDTKTSFNGNAELKGKVTPTFDAQLSTKLHINLPSGSPVKQANLTTDITASAKQLTLSSLVLDADNLKIQGNVSVPFAQTAPISFKLQANEIDLDKLLANSTPKPSSDKSVPVETREKTKSTTSSAPKSNSRPIRGELSLNQIIIKGLTLQHVKTSLKKEGSLLTLSPFTADLYQGTLTTVIKYPLENKQAPIYFNGKLNNIALESLLSALKQKQMISGRADVNFNLSQTGKNLNGVTSLQIKEGIINGVDVYYYLERARAMIKKEEFTLEDSKKTPFQTLTGTLHFQNNVMENNDLILTAQDFKATGEGELDFNQQTIAYKFQAKKIYHDGLEHANALPLAIRIKGKLEKPRITPDFDLYLKTFIERGVKQKISNGIDKQISKILKEDENPDKTREELIQEKLEQKLNKGLEKIFKF